MRVGMIGIGDIAKKAYLPVITRKKNIDIILCSRNENLLNEMMKTYRGIQYVTSVKALIESKIDAAFVHAATAAHYEICKELLENGIHVYVDKPISYHIKEVRTLFELAKEKNLILRVGFNRREAPFVKAMKELEQPDIVIYQKNRVNLPANIREYIFDDFIHVVDSIRYLLGEEVETFHVKGKIVDDQLYSVTLQLVGKHGVAIGIMNRESGKNEERIEYICPGEKRIVEDLNTLTIFKDGIESHHKFGDWENVLYRRGFEQVTDLFIKDVSGEGTYLESDEDSIKTHELCELIVQELTVSSEFN